MRLASARSKKRSKCVCGAGVWPQVSPSAGQGAEAVSFGQPTFARDGSGLVLVGWPHLAPNFPAVHKRLGG